MSVIKYLKQNNDTENQMYINMDFLGLDLSKVPQEKFWRLESICNTSFICDFINSINKIDNKYDQ